VTSTTAAPATTAAAGPTRVTAAPLADSGSESGPVLVLGAVAVGVALATSRLRGRARPGRG